MQSLYALSLSTLLITPLLVTGCSSGSDSTSSDSNSSRTVALSIPFEAEANATAISCDSNLTGLGLAGTDASVLDFRFYLHDIRVSTDAGRTLTLTLDDNAWQNSGVALIDFQNRADSCSGDAKAVHPTVTGKVTLDEGEEVNSLAFTVGLPASLNHENPTLAESPLNIASLFWNWQGGYKFMRLDIAPTGGVTRPSDALYLNSSWNFHLGSTNCSGDPQLDEEVTCARSNRVNISLDGYVAGTDIVVVDYGALIAAANVGQDEAGAPGCMSGATDPECAPVFSALGLDLASGDMDGSSTQTVFSLK